MKPRITMSLDERGQFHLYVNEAGRDELVGLLQSLDRKHEHFHLAPAEWGMECELSQVPYRETDQVISWGKVFLRPDDWDREYFPHVISQTD